MELDVEIIDVCPRDGLQNETRILSPQTRAVLIERLAAAGLRRIEAVSLVSEARVPAMAGAETVLEALRGRLPKDVSLSGLCLNSRGVERALSSDLAEINLVILASDSFNRRNQGKPRDVTLAEISALAPRIHQAGRRVSVTIGAAFGCPFEGETDPGLIASIAAELADAGVGEIALADTIGVGVPRDVRARFAAVARTTGDRVALRAHFHDTRVTGIANALAAIEAGVTRLDSAVGGFGGCPFAPAATGNIATEDLVYALERSGWRTGLDLDALIATGGWLAGHLDRAAPAALGRAGPFPPSAAASQAGPEQYSPRKLAQTKEGRSA